MLDKLRGSKTYIVSIATGLYGIGIMLNWWPHSVAIDAILGGSGLAALRAGISNEAPPKPPAS